MKYVSRLEEHQRSQDAATLCDRNHKGPPTRLSDMNKQGVAFSPNVSSVEEQIASAAEWCKNHAGEAETSICHERLGSTYVLEDNSEQALKHFTKAQEMPDYSWQVFQESANVHSRRK